MAEAAANPGGAVAAIDPDYIGHPDGFVPGEAVHGYWLVGEDGKLTGEFRENPDYGPPKDDFAKLTGTDHWLGWLGDDPAGAVRGGILDCLLPQVPTAVLEWVKILDEPRFLTFARRRPDDEESIVVTRAGLTVSFALSVVGGAKREVLTGAFSWAAVRLDRPGGRKDRFWLDLWTDLDPAAEQLRERIYAVGSGGGTAGPGAG
ncbi:hypothetical protein [Streptomyces sp. NRRL F-5123]|uniref:hypothetical protein n=1 Tax=Streptomyces sp. NRRL F-5123 TaxID=1463856 RepID=UPI000A7951BB|nr:hypothetical protein [Streptomyces sp. NRRL F-5123]